MLKIDLRQCQSAKLLSKRSKRYQSVRFDVSNATFCMSDSEIFPDSPLLKYTKIYHSLAKL